MPTAGCLRKLAQAAAMRSRAAITSDESGIARYEDKATGTARSFCATLSYEPVRASAHMSG